MANAGTDRVLLFLCGADMHPSAIRARYPAARFVEVAHCAAPLPGLSALAPLNEEGVWGIVVRVPETAADAAEVAVTLQDGQLTTATLATQPADVADTAAVVAAVRYWELPPTYRARAMALAEADSQKH